MKKRIIALLLALMLCLSFLPAAYASEESASDTPPAEETEPPEKPAAEDASAEEAADAPESEAEAEPVEEAEALPESEAEAALEAEIEEEPALEAAEEEPAEPPALDGALNIIPESGKVISCSVSSSSGYYSAYDEDLGWNYNSGWRSYAGMEGYRLICHLEISDPIVMETLEEAGWRIYFGDGEDTWVWDVVELSFTAENVTLSASVKTSDVRIDCGRAVIPAGTTLALGEGGRLSCAELLVRGRIEEESEASVSVSRYMEGFENISGDLGRGISLYPENGTELAVCLEEAGKIAARNAEETLDNWTANVIVRSDMSVTGKVTVPEGVVLGMGSYSAAAALVLDSGAELTNLGTIRFERGGARLTVQEGAVLTNAGVIEQFAAEPDTLAVRGTLINEKGGSLWWNPGAIRVTGRLENHVATGERGGMTYGTLYGLGRIDSPDYWLNPVFRIREEQDLETVRAELNASTKVDTQYGIEIYVEEDLTLTGTLELPGQDRFGDKLFILNGVTLTVPEGAELVNGDATIFLYNGGSLNVNGGTLTNEAAVFVGYYTDSGGEPCFLRMSGGTLENNGLLWIYTENGSNARMTGGNYTGDGSIRLYDTTLADMPDHLPGFDLTGFDAEENDEPSVTLTPKEPEGPVIPPALLGDSNGDGVIDRADRVYLAYALADRNDMSLPSLVTADLNWDGVVDRVDRICLARALEGWPDYTLS